MTTLYWKSTCTTCREVRSALKARPGGADLAEKNYSKDPLTEADVRAIVAASDVPTLLNATHETAKARGWKAAPPDAATFIAAAFVEPNLLRRPILLVDTPAGPRAWVHRACLDAPVGR